MTIFGHRPSKELVVVDDPYDPTVAQAVAVQAADLPAVERVRRGVLADCYRVDGGRAAPTFEAAVATAAVIGALTAPLLEWANDPDAGRMGDAVTAALALLEIQPSP